MNQNERINRLALSTIEGLGPQRFLTLLRAYKSITKVFQSPNTNTPRIRAILGDKIFLKLINFNWRLFKDYIKMLEEMEISFVVFGEKDYPKSLENIYDPPIALYIKGKVKKLTVGKSITIVGTRNNTMYGEIITKNIIKALVNNNFTIISGMAFGIDTIAHQAAIEFGGQTIAVLAGNVNESIPSSNFDLYNKIIISGAIVSENSLNHKLYRADFVRRNRILAALSQGTLVIEAGDKSGALITSKFALEYNREVFAIPGNINLEKSKGTNMLIKKGEAMLVQTPEDILQEFGISYFSNKENIIIPKNKLEKEILDMIIKGTSDIDMLAQKIILVYLKYVLFFP